MEDIESKLDLLIDLYKEDRQLVLRHVLGGQNAPEGPTVESRKKPQPLSSIKPRPILVDKQYTSEPNTPTGLRNPSRPMQRNLSDLGQRIKKRVTYRCLSYNEVPHRTMSERITYDRNRPIKDLFSAEPRPARSCLLPPSTKDQLPLRDEQTPLCFVCSEEKEAFVEEINMEEGASSASSQNKGQNVHKTLCATKSVTNNVAVT